MLQSVSSFGSDFGSRYGMSYRMSGSVSRSCQTIRLELLGVETEGVSVVIDLA